GATYINAGTLAGTTTSLVGNISNNAALIFDQTLPTVAITSGTYAGVISGTGTVAKNNAGTVIISNANTYTGATTLSSGTLIVANTSGSATGTGDVTLNGGKLASSAGSGGFISGNVIAGAGSHILSPGGDGSIGALTVGGLSLNSFSTLNFDI